jgi:type I restriction-modification system DNA methylase subunit
MMKSTRTPLHVKSSSAASFSELSIKLTEKLSKDEKRNGGIFFTPPSCVQSILALLRSTADAMGVGVSKTIRHIMEPSCGSGEFITALSKEYPDAMITGIEYNPVIYEEISKTFANRDKIVVRHADFLTTEVEGDDAVPVPDLIIGNPPYFVMKKEEVAKEYYPYFEGRPNIFALFIIKAATMLRAGGLLCFVLPCSFMNSSYYDKTRKYIISHFTVLHVVRCETLDSSVKYIDTVQDTIVLIIQKKPTDGGDGGGGGVYEKYGMTIFTDNIPRLVRLYKGSRSLYELDFNVHVGTVVWNQCKDILTSDASKTRLIYSSNIVNGKFVDKTYKNAEKKAFIEKAGIQTPMIVLNRGYGVGEYKFDYCFISPEIVGSDAFLVENHLICITSRRVTESLSSSLDRFQAVIRSFQDPRTKEFIACYFGNNAVNTNELNHMLPIYGGGEGDGECDGECDGEDETHEI